jgi:hypothetical protein
MEAREVKTPEEIEVPAIGGEHLATSTVCSGPNTNPWRAEATARVLERGDLFTSTPTPSAWGAISSASRGRCCAAISPPRERNARPIEHHTTGWR